MALDHARYEKEVLRFFDQLPESAFRRVDCIFCKEKTRRVVLFKKGTMRVVRCKCGFVYNERQANPSALTAFYRKSEAMTSWSRIKTSEAEDARQKQKFGRAIKFITDSKAKSVLDFGCGNGTFLALAKDAGVPMVHGIEPNEDAAEVARSRGIWVNEHHSWRFDYASAWGVLEHHPEPFDLIRALKTFTGNKGHVVVCVPNVEAPVVTTLWKDCFTFCPQHLWYFSMQTLTDLLDLCGLEVVEMHTIEPEAKPYLKRLSGFKPYRKLPKWAEIQYLAPDYVRRVENEIMECDQGYKIVAIAAVSQ